ncbi:MAG TPA: DUF2520 domain-containing protein [Terriglobales bacterium]|jgi:predicted short-subunit dehydrogenase-like oxidoreductase (DUF2520 family)|nr:DUF2520 domain-containing protein [Terriglobales bacterium]
MLPAMAAKPNITIVGPGRLGTGLAVELRRAGYRLCEIVSRKASQRTAGALAKSTGGRTATVKTALLDADLLWLSVPDGEIAALAQQLAPRARWRGKIVFHSSGALASAELDVLRQRGAAVAAVHPFMTFVRGSIPSLAGVPFGVEGDAAAVRVARRVVRDLGGEVFSVARGKKSAYHAWGAFTSPLLVALLVTAEEVAGVAGFSQTEARKNILPIVRQTIANYAKLGPAGAFSGPIVRGDADTVRKHLQALRKVPAARAVYVALARVALRRLPAGNRRELERALHG